MPDLKDAPREEGRKDGRGGVVIRASLRKEVLESEEMRLDPQPW